MGSVLLLGGLTVLGATSYLLGLHDRPKFTSGKLLLVTEDEKQEGADLKKEKDDCPAKNDDNEKSNQSWWFAIVAVSREKNIGQHVMRLIEGTKKGIVASLPNASQCLKDGCRTYLRYNTEEKGKEEHIPDSLCVGLFFDDPSKVAHPRWAIGWAVQGGKGDEFLDITSFSKMQGELQKNSGLNLEDNEIRIIRLAPVGTCRAHGGNVDIEHRNIPMAFRGKIPWRTPITPMIAPMLHWKRAFAEFSQLDPVTSSSTSCLKSDDSNRREGPISMEVYVMKQQWFQSYIDYIILYENNDMIWDDAFPSKDSN